MADMDVDQILRDIQREYLEFLDDEVSVTSYHLIILFALLVFKSSVYNLGRWRHL